MTDNLTRTHDLTGTEPVIWVGEWPFTKKGFPARSNFGASVRQVVILEMATWKRLCGENPGLQKQLFAVGSV